jgi:hypothetical protein
MVKIGLIGGSRISSDCSNRIGRTGKRLLDRPRKTLSKEEQPGGEESKGEHAEVFQAATEFDGISVCHAGCNKVP